MPDAETLRFWRLISDSESEFQAKLARYGRRLSSEIPHLDLLTTSQ